MGQPLPQQAFQVQQPGFGMSPFQVVVVQEANKDAQLKVAEIDRRIDGDEFCFYKFLLYIYIIILVLIMLIVLILGVFVGDVFFAAGAAANSASSNVDSGAVNSAVG